MFLHFVEMAKNPSDTKPISINKCMMHSSDGLYQMAHHGRLSEIDAYIHKMPAEYCFSRLFSENHGQKLTLLMLAALWT